MKRNAKKILSIILAFVVVFTSCMVESPTTVESATKKPSKITLNYKSTTSYVGGTVKLKVASVTPKKASKSVTWKSSNTKIAVVNSKGVVKAKKTGTVTITAKSKVNPKVKASCKLKVYKATKTLKLISKKSYTLNIGHTITLQAKVTSPKKGAQPIQYNSDNNKIAKVDKKGKVTALKAGTANIIIRSGKKQVKVQIIVSENGTSDAESVPEPAPTPEPDPDPTPTPTPEPTPEPDPADEIDTRAEWAATLVDRLGYSLDEENILRDADTDKLSYTYDDIENSAYALKIETAYQYGLLPAVDTTDSNSHFSPNDPITREFAVVTAVKALGFSVEENLNCTDSSELSYPAEDKIGVDTGMVALKDGSFVPVDILSDTELKQILQIVDGILAQRAIDTTHEDVIVYTDEVADGTDTISNYVVQAVGNGFQVCLPLTEYSKSLAAGDILTLPATEEYPNGLAWRADQVTINEASSQVEVTGSFPELAEVYRSIDIEGIVDDTAGTVTLADDVVLAEVDEEIKALDQGGSIDVSKICNKTITCNLDDNSTITFTFKIPKIQYSLKASFWNHSVDEFYLEIPNEISADVNISGSLSGKKDLFTVTVPLSAGFSVDVVVSVSYAMDGSVKLVYTLNNSVGVQYINNKLVWI